MADPFLGELKLVALNFAPRGWVPCDGRLLPKAANMQLFNLLGTKYGGDGINNFAVPDLRGRIAIGPTTGIDQGASGGEETHALTLNELPAHTHTPRANNSNGNQAGPGGGVWANDSAKLNPPYRSGGANATMHAQSITATGGGQGHDNMQPFLVLHWIIAVQGIYPQ